jgi:hypothetical protein
VAQGLTRVALPVLEIPLRDDAKRADGGEHPAFSAVDLVHAIAFSNRPTVTPARQGQVVHEHIARVTIGHMIAFAAPATAAAVAVAEVVANTVICWARIVPV